MGRSVVLGVVVGIASGLASAFILKLCGIDLTPAVVGGAVGASVGAVVASISTKAKPSAGE